MNGSRPLHRTRLLLRSASTYRHFPNAEWAEQKRFITLTGDELKYNYGTRGATALVLALGRALDASRLLMVIAIPKIDDIMSFITPQLALLVLAVLALLIATLVLVTLAER